MALYVAHNRSLTVLHADLESHAFQQREVFVGTAGSVIERKNAAGYRFYAHKYYDALGKPRERYLAGPIGDAEVEARADELRIRIGEVKEVASSLRMLGREGFCLVDAKTYATIATLHNHGVFAAGGLLIGSHAYGVLLNRLGIRAAAYATEDIDIARPQTLAFAGLPQASLLEVLKESAIDFVEVPSLDRKAPATSFKERGRARFHVDLLVPSRGETFPTIAVPELGAHATGLPYLGFLLEASQPGIVMARQGCCAVRVPLAERFALHKLIASRLRTGREAKSENDLDQASVLFAALAETHPGAIEEARAAIPVRAKKHVRAALAALRPRLEAAAPRAWAELQSS